MMVSMLSEIVALKRGYSPAASRQIRIAARLHDIGKLKLPEEIINKPGELDADEFEVIKTHTILGAEMLSSLHGDIGVVVREVCRHHHEWWDGSRSYWGKRASELPEYVSIVSLSDVFSALIHPRQYKESWTRAAALEYIQSQAGTQFCHELAEDFISVIHSDSRVSALLAGM